MAQPVYVVNGGDGTGEAGLVAFVIAIPALMPAFHVIGYVCDLLTQQNLHPLFKLLAEAAVIGAMGYALYLFFRFLPTFLTIALSVAYMGYTYGMLVYGWGADSIWSSGAGVVVGILTFFMARATAAAAKAQ